MNGDSGRWEDHRIHLLSKPLLSPVEGIDDDYCGEGAASLSLNSPPDRRHSSSFATLPQRIAADWVYPIVSLTLFGLSLLATLEWKTLHLVSTCVIHGYSSTVPLRAALPFVTLSFVAPIVSVFILKWDKGEKVTLRSRQAGSVALPALLILFSGFASLALPLILSTSGIAYKITAPISVAIAALSSMIGVRVMRALSPFRPSYFRILSGRMADTADAILIACTLLNSGGIFEGYSGVESESIRRAKLGPFAASKLLASALGACIFFRACIFSATYTRRGFAAASAASMWASEKVHASPLDLVVVVCRRSIALACFARFIIADASARYVSGDIDAKFIVGSSFARLVFVSSCVSAIHILCATCSVLRGSSFKPLQRSESPSEDAAGFFSRFTFWWVTPTLRVAARIAAGKDGNKNKLEEDDLPSLPQKDAPQSLFASFATHLKSKLAQKGRISGLSVLVTTFFSIQKSVFLYSLLTGYTFLSCMFADPILLRRLLANGTVNIAESLMYVGLLTLSMMIRVACMEVCFFASVRCMNNAGSALIHAVFRKSMTLPDVHEKEEDEDDKIESTNAVPGAGKLTNLMATDADKLRKSSWLIFYFAMVTYSIFSLPPTVWFMQNLLGSAAYVGMATLIMGGALSRYIGQLTRPVVKRLQECRDARSKFTKEFVRTVKVAKVQGWEDGWARLINDSRDREMRVLKKVRLLDALNQLVGGLTSFAIPVATFSWYTLYQGRTLDATTAFTALAWINQMNWSITTLPTIFNVYSALAPSAKRLAQLLSLNCGSGNSWLDDAGEDDESFSDFSFGGPLLETSELAIGYDGKAVISDLTLRVHRGELIIVTGPVGCGKSTLLDVLSGAVQPISGTCKCHLPRAAGARRKAYVSQKPFLLSSNIRDNVLFGLDYDRERYLKAIEDAELGPDLEALHKGDATVVGEAGVQLSGGQRARICIARAFYSNAPLLVFDDVLAAVDAETGRKLFSTLQRAAFSEKRAVILATHQLQYVAFGRVSRAVAIVDGKCTVAASEASINAIKSELNVEFSDLPVDGAPKDAKKRPESEDEKDAHLENGNRAALASNNEDAHLVTLEECVAHVEKVLKSCRGEALDDARIAKMMKQLLGLSEGGEEDKEEVEEERSAGLISWRDFKLYFDVFGTRTMRIALLVCILVVASLQVASNIWLTVWSDSANNNSTLSGKTFLSVYAGIGVSACVSLSLQTVLLTFCALYASGIIHAKMISRLIYAPLAFFEYTPSGRIMNRCLQDMASIDNFVPNSLLDQATKTINVVGQLALVFFFAPWVLATVPFLLIIYAFIFTRVRVAARDTRRIEAVAHSPCYAHFSDMLSGRRTMRAYDAGDTFAAQNQENIAKMARSKYSMEAVSKWAQSLTTLTGCMLYAACGICGVYLVSRGKLDTGHLGLILLYAAQLQRSGMDYMMGLTNLEVNLVSVERVAEYCRVEGEDSPPQRGAAPSSPSENAAIVFAGVSMRYRIHHPLVLQNLSLVIKKNTKNAMCGRTGCGKSTVFSCLASLYPIQRGYASIENTMISGARNAEMVRSHRQLVSVLTQDPLLFSGSVRENLLGPNSIPRRSSPLDSEIWDVLRQVGMHDRISSMPLKLDAGVQEGGDNFSAGERQLLCTARVLLSRKNVVLCDEATANVDLASDELIHNVLLGLPQCTLVMICHRMQYIRRFQQVYVLGSGRLLESGNPKALLSDSTSTLHSLCNEEAGAYP